MEGYAKIATFMAAYPEVAIVRRFAALNTQNILYMQAELVLLESRLRKLENADQQSGDRMRELQSFEWSQLSSPLKAETGGGSDDHDQGSDSNSNGCKDSEQDWPIMSERWNLMLQIRAKLKCYNEAILHQATINQLQKPKPQTVNFLAQWMNRPDMGCVYLLGQDSDVWENADRLDLAVLKRRRRESIFSALLADCLVRWYHQNIGRHLKESSQSHSTPDMASSRLDEIAQSSGTKYHSETALARLARVFAMSLASTLPVASIVILYCVDSMPQRLGIIGGFTAAFTFILGLLTNGDLVDVFAASAAFAAVQVVFVGSTRNPS